MRRRGALAELLGLACCPFPVRAGRGDGQAALAAEAPEAASAAPSRDAADVGGVLVAGPSGLWAGHGRGGLLERLPGLDETMAPPAVTPVTGSGGVWGAAAARRLLHWRREPGGRWSVAASCEFDEPIRALAASADGALALAAHGEQLTLLDAAGAVVRRYDGTNLERRRRGGATALFSLARRRSIVAVWPGFGELWEISLDPAAEPIFDGFVHDYRMGEGIATSGYLGARRTRLDTPMLDVGFADGRVAWLAGMLDQQVQVIHLDVRRRIAAWPQPEATPRSALLCRQGDAWVWWLPAGRTVHLVETARWQPVGRETLPGPVHALQALGDTVWALVGKPPETSLMRRLEGNWVPVLPGEFAVRGVVAGHGGARMLVLGARPTRLLALDREGRPCEEWMLPSGVAAWSARWLPAPA